MLRVLFFIVVYGLLALCHSCSQKEYEESFDIPLIKKNEEFQSLGEYDSLVQLNKKYYQLADELNYEDGKALCYINLGCANFRIGNYPKSRILFEYAEKIIKDSKNPVHKAIFYIEFAQLNSDFRRYDLATEYSTIALDYVIKSKDSWLKNYVLAKTYMNKANFFVNKKQYDKAIEYYNKSRKFNRPEALYNNIGNFYLYYGGDLDSAKIYLSKAVQVCNESGKKSHSAAVAYTTMGEYYTKTKQYDKAEKMYFKALEIDKKTSRIFKYLTSDLYYELKTIYKEKGDDEKAYFYLKAYIDTKKRPRNLKLTAANQDINAFIVNAKKDAQKGRNKILILIIIGFTVFAFSGIYSWQMIDLLRQKKIKLKNEAKQLKGKMDDTITEKSIELARRNDPSFLKVFREAYPGFIEKILTIDSNLEDSELVFCAMLKLHFSSKEIAGFTSIQHRTVQQKKYRIRKKLNIPQETDTYLFFDQLLQSND
ncbi:MAG: tetratricopeptide repeat protein [Chryseobacterium sp.]|jgi:tetratricopeptide (TPR) repeat protein|nr:tetratricopeptide repeat protein [Chryseobacterium sp.]